MGIEEDWTREAIRLHRRYQGEVVEGYGLCPWSDRAVRDGRVRERVALQTTAAVEPSLAAIDAWTTDVKADVAFLIYPKLKIDRRAFHDFVAKIRDADTPRHALGCAPFVFAAFHPDAPPDTTDPERLIPFWRRTPDPTLQLVRASVLDSVRTGASQGTQFVNVASLDAALSGTGCPPLRERIARTNLATAARVGLHVVSERMDDIRRDRDETYRTLDALLS